MNPRQYTDRRYEDTLPALWADTLCIDYEAGLKYDFYNFRWQISTRHRWMIDTQGEALQLVIRYMLAGKIGELRLVGPDDEIVELYVQAAIFAKGFRQSQERLGV